MKHSLSLHSRRWILLSALLGLMLTARLCPAETKSLKAEKLTGEGVWLMPILARLRNNREIAVKIWFEEQLLGSGDSYMMRAEQLKGRKRTELRAEAIKSLKEISQRSYDRAKKQLDQLVADKKIRGIRRHWIVNGFSCVATPAGLKELEKVAGVRAIFADMRPGGRARRVAAKGPFFKESKDNKPAFRADRYKHPWYARYLLADRVWSEFGVTGKGTLNIISDGNFVFYDGITSSLYRNPKEIPDNGKDDDGNGLIDDFHGYDFDLKTSRLTRAQPSQPAAQLRLLHGSMCAAIICGAGDEKVNVEFGVAPEGRWAGVIAQTRLEDAVEWAVEQKADTYSMSFSIPGLGHYRSYWRKVLEHGSLCGVYFVSGAGNFAQQVPVPVQMRTPEDIPNVVFAAAGVQRSFARTPFSSKGPVKWELEHYKDGQVQKPEVCAFNFNLPRLLPGGQVLPGGASGNSFAGPMFCGSIALMLSADPDLLPWDLKEIITTTATDVGPKGVDFQTGHGLINCYRAVKEVLRRKAVRDGQDPKKYEGRTEGDSIEIASFKNKQSSGKLRIAQLAPGDTQARRLGLKVGDEIVKYNGQPIADRLQLQGAKQQATRKKVQSIPVVIRRDGKELEFKFKPGPLGFVPQVIFDDPVFK